MADAALAVPSAPAVDVPNPDGSHTLAAPGITPDTSPGSFTKTGGNNPLLVTSSNSRSTYNDNVSKLNTITSGMSTIPTDPTAGQLANRTAAVGGNNTGDGTTPVKPEDGLASARGAGGTYVGSDNKLYYNYDSSPVSSGSGDNGGLNTGSQTMQRALASGIDPSLVSAFGENYKQLNAQAEDAKATLDSAKATAANDPALAAAITDIQTKFGTLIDAMNRKNEMLLGRANLSVAAFGGLGQMSQNFLTDQASSALARIGDLQNKESSLILKTKMAYESKDVKAVNAAMKDYQNVIKDKTKAILDLQTKINDAVKTEQAQQRIDAAAEKQSLAGDISKSTNLGSTIATTIASSGVKDEAQIDQYIQGMAEQNGIKNWAILKNAVLKAQAAAEKAASAAANTADTITNRDKRTNIAQENADKKGSGSKNFNVSQGIAKVTPQFESIKGGDGYIDPAKWIAARTTWNSLGGTDATFVSNFKKYLNPASYTQAGLPAKKGKS